MVVVIVVAKELRELVLEEVQIQPKSVRRHHFGDFLREIISYRESQ